MEQAHQKNLYFKRIKSMMGIMGSESAFDLIDPSSIEALYYYRLHPIKLKSLVYNNLSISVKDLKILNEQLKRLLKEAYINLGVNKTPVSIYDFYIFIETIYLLWRNASEIKFPNYEKFKELLPAFKDNYRQIRENAHKIVEDNVNLISWIFSDILHQIIWMKHDRKNEHSDSLDNSIFYNNYFIQIDKPETLSIEIDGKKRNIYRLGVSLPLEGIIWLTTTPGNLGMNGILNNLPLKIYIQQHAVIRLKERLGESFDHFNYFLITTSILANDVHRSDDGSFMFSLKYMNVKVGYFKADIIDNKLLIRTFLFVTNNGTPEGKKLADLLGVQKEDKKYLGIDKLNTFINSDIEEDEKLKLIFCQIGCEGLFSLKKYLKKEQDGILHYANYITQYLGMEKGKE